MIQNVCDNTNVEHVIERYHSLMFVIAEDWKHTVQTEELISLIDIIPACIKSYHEIVLPCITISGFLNSG
jgi:hypothetical protein